MVTVRGRSTLRFLNGLLGSGSLCIALLDAAPAGAASLQQLGQSEWQGGVSGLPAYVNMYLYVPDRLATRPPVVVAPHHCQGTGPGTFGEMSSLVARADQSGFILIFPEATGQNCWDAGSSRSLTHDGTGDTHAVVQMVRHVLATFVGNPARVYSVGGSSGGIMTEALLGVYPDVFMAGVSYMGVPAGCWAEGYNDVLGKPENGTGQWSGPCSGGTVTKSSEEWGSLVRSFFPEHVGHRPRLQHWHGTADTVIRFANLAEDIKQWTDVLALSETPNGTDTPSTGTTRQYWNNACGYTVYEAFSLAGIGHAVPFDGDAVTTYFGLGDAEGSDPETAACSGAEPSSAGPGGAGGAASSGDGVAPTTETDGTLGAVTPPSDGAGATSGSASSPAAGAPTIPVAAPGASGTSPGGPGADPVDTEEHPPDPSALDAGSAVNSDSCACSLPAPASHSRACAAALLAGTLGLVARRRRNRSASVHPPRRSDAELRARSRRVRSRAVGAGINPRR
jgi:acetylxylan esterase